MIPQEFKQVARWYWKYYYRPRIVNVWIVFKFKYFGGRARAEAQRKEYTKGSPATKLFYSDGQIPVFLDSFIPDKLTKSKWRSPFKKWWFDHHMSRDKQHIEENIYWHVKELRRLIKKAKKIKI